MAGSQRLKEEAMKPANLDWVIPILLVMTLSCCRTQSGPVSSAAKPPQKGTGSPVDDADLAFRDGGDGCRYSLVPLTVGVCKATEVGLAYTQFKTASCGVAVELCGKPVPCDCANAVDAFPCEPQRKEVWPYPFEKDRRYDAVELSRAMATAEVERSMLKPRFYETDYDGGGCALSLGPPEYGECPIGGAMFEGTSVRDIHGSMYVPFGGVREVCGIALRCQCAEFVDGGP